MISNSKNQYQFLFKPYILSLILGFIWSIMVLGEHLFPWEVHFWENAESDPLTHYSSWLIFASDSFHFPWTYSNKLAYPHGTSLVYTDSIPILGIIFKLFFKLLHQDLQYFGVHFWLSSSLAFYCTYRILNDFFKLHPFLKYTTCTLFMTSPIASVRIQGHEALSSHWIIIACIYLYLASEQIKEVAFHLILYTLLFISFGIHAYLSSFVVLTILALVFHKAILRKFKFALLLALELFLLLPTFLLFWGYSFGSASTKGSLWSANLLALFDSHNNSRFFSALPKHMPYQWEGFSYLGLGVIISIILLFLFYVFSSHISIKSFYIFHSSKAILALFLIILLFIYSLGNPVFLGSKPIFMIGNEEHYIPVAHEIFRSTGRYLWLIYYSLILFLIFCFSTDFPGFLSIWILPLLLTLNIYESNLYVGQSINYLINNRNYHQSLSEPTEHKLAEIIDESNPMFLLSYPAFGCVASPVITYPVAAKYKLATNNLYLARYSLEYFQFNCIDMPNLLESDHNANDLQSPYNSDVKLVIKNLRNSIVITNQKSLYMSSQLHEIEVDGLYIYYDSKS